MAPHLDKSNLACADVTFEVFDDDLSVMLQIALLAKDVMDASRYFVPLIVFTIPEENPQMQNIWSSLTQMVNFKSKKMANNSDCSFSKVRIQTFIWVF